jgi:hypothetical protein
MHAAARAPAVASVPPPLVGMEARVELPAGAGGRGWTTTRSRRGLWWQIEILLRRPQFRRGLAPSRRREAAEELVLPISGSGSSSCPSSSPSDLLRRPHATSPCAYGGGSSSQAADRAPLSGGLRSGTARLLLPPAAPASSPSPLLRRSERWRAAVGAARTKAVGTRAPRTSPFPVSSRILWIWRKREATGFPRAPGGMPLQVSKRQKAPGGADGAFLEAPVRVVSASAK